MSEIIRQHHLILRQNLDVQMTVPEQEGLKWQKEISHFAKAVLQTELEEVLDSVVGPDKIFRIEKLDLEVTSDFRALGWELDLASQIAKMFHQKLADITEHSQADNQISRLLNHEEFQSLDKFQSMLDQFLFFLTYGYLPWYAGPAARQDLENSVLQVLKQNLPTTSFKDTLTVLIQRRDVINRMVWQFSDQFFLTLIEVLHPEAMLKLKHNTSLMQWLSSSSQETALKEWFWRKFLQNPTEMYTSIAAIENRHEDQSLNTRLQQLQASEVKVDDTTDVSSKQNTKVKYWHIENAGLVLLYPFLNTFLQEAGVVSDGQIKNADQAIQLLQFLATSQEGTPEQLLTLNKVLCGIAIEQPIRKDVTIPDEDKAEAKKLLESVIQHWAVLRNTSVENLQGSFLCRKGKLVHLENGDWRLHVEPKGWDILLAQIPWSYSIIKLPWMKNILWVDWET